MALLIAVLVFFALITLVVGVWWAAEGRRRVGQRLATTSSSGTQNILRGAAGPSRLSPLMRSTRTWRWLERLVLQAGYRDRASDVALVVLAFAMVGGALAALRTGGIAWGILAA